MEMGNPKVLSFRYGWIQLLKSSGSCPSLSLGSALLCVASFSSRLPSHGVKDVPEQLQADILSIQNPSGKVPYNSVSKIPDVDSSFVTLTQILWLSCLGHSDWILLSHMVLR